MTTVASFLYSTHDELLARRHSERSNRVASSTPKLTSSLDSEPATSCPASDVASYILYSTHDELLARCHSDRSSRVASSTPKLTSSLDSDPAARSTASDVEDDYTCSRASSQMTRVASYFPNSIHDEVLARCHSNRSTLSLHGVGRLARCHSDRSSRVGATTPKLMSSLDYTDSDMSHDDAFSRASTFEPTVWGDFARSERAE
ncbi:hypothetical protein T484DRAFT_3630049 [Baffinella frigidus]|nr:hypothetical protein T484DRAFT_3630049 [Cryptophyta sp. CCMP2293]